MQLLAKAHQPVKRQRQDFQHKAALKLVREYDTIYHEDLQVANMVKNHHLAKSISDAGWSGFLTILTGKAAYAGQASRSRATCLYQPDSALAVASSSRKGLSVRWHAARSAERVCTETTMPPRT